MQCFDHMCQSVHCQCLSMGFPEFFATVIQDGGVQRGLGEDKGCSVECWLNLHLLSCTLSRVVCWFVLQLMVFQIWRQCGSNPPSNQWISGINILYSSFFQSIIFYTRDQLYTFSESALTKKTYKIAQTTMYKVYFFIKKYIIRNSISFPWYHKDLFPLQSRIRQVCGGGHPLVFDAA